MEDKRLAEILTKQKAIADRRKADEEAQRQRAIEDERRAQDILVKWDHVRNGLKKQIFELNKAMEPNEIALEFREGEALQAIPHSAIINYKSPKEYRGMRYVLRLNVNVHGLLTIGIGSAASTVASEKINIVDVDEIKQRNWLLDFLDRTTELQGTRS